MTHYTNPALTLHQRYIREWVEGIMNLTVFGLYADLPVSLFRLEMCWHIAGDRWYIVGEGVTVWREGDGRSPVEPVVPGDYHGPNPEIL